MTRRSHLRLGIAIIGIILWSYGVRVDDSTFRLIGIAALAVAALLRFWK